MVQTFPNHRTLMAAAMRFGPKLRIFEHNFSLQRWFLAKKISESKLTHVKVLAKTKSRKVNYSSDIVNIIYHTLRNKYTLHYRDYCGKFQLLSALMRLIAYLSLALLIDRWTLKLRLMDLSRIDFVTSYGKHSNTVRAPSNGGWA